MPALSTFVQSMKLPVMPEAAQALIRTLNDENADIITVRDIIATDPALTTTLLRMANSATFGLSRSITTLEAAVSVLGIAQIRARALSVCMSNTFAMPAGVNRIAFWQECMKCAGYARWLALSQGLDENQAWLTGIMLPLGRILVIQSNHQHIKTLEAQPCVPGERWKREHALVGFDEGQIMAEVARRWDFPPSMARALDVCTQAPMDDTYPALAGVLHLAALLAEYPKVTTETLAELPPGVVHKLGLNLLWMSVHLPDADAFVDTTLLQG